ncbi:phosphopantothenoylcysteine decarboxylase / phosphopantothenate--cysteine ligase [Thermotomaculum hydrothermale]|uniref:Coenzyme A biosynthesis bifunctional protein CoaBC n=1 Tax=Thermotomaculum hydrothermale TaxID=981385 RepID=A0A7R6PN84_9BACT|nr:bifunctional phosphopantothenoylcysteine decarboxylase/phosphopantothenate synthase [Thermotomaculum hydrothermale]BBB32693.1 phosphopantothenoylcysteine decarboxylase / phosphopantothenate--cysteine ligase [Thermotomaculum hydrothermale]
MKLIDYQAGILIGVSSGIACYKSIEVIRELQKRGYKNIETVLTKNTVNFLSPNLFEAITGNKPYIDVFEEGRLLSHIKAVEDKKVFAIVPATANIIGKLANGIADDFLTTCYLAFKGKTLIFPSMNVNMLEHPVTERNLLRLQQDGCFVVEPDSGYLACGYSGKGRLPSIEIIADYIELFANLKGKSIFNQPVQIKMFENEEPAPEPIDPLAGKKVLITSGGTVEPIDSVRVITNRSSGTMGRQLAKVFSILGADVTVITGNHSVRYPVYAKVVEVKTVEEMYREVAIRFEESDIVVMAAAISDFKVKNYSSNKIKKKQSLTLELEKTIDILETLGKTKKHQILVGFAAETNDLLENAKDKLKRKNADLIVANKVGENSGFGDRKLDGYFVFKDGRAEEFSLTKTETAEKIGEIVIKEFFNG